MYSDIKQHSSTMQNRNSFWTNLILSLWFFKILYSYLYTTTEWAFFPLSIKVTGCLTELTSLVSLLAWYICVCTHVCACTPSGRTTTQWFPILLSVKLTQLGPFIWHCNQQQPHSGSISFQLPCWLERRQVWLIQVTILFWFCLWNRPVWLVMSHLSGHLPGTVLIFSTYFSLLLWPNICLIFQHVSSLLSGWK